MQCYLMFHSHKLLNGHSWDLDTYDAMRHIFQNALIIIVSLKGAFHLSNRSESLSWQSSSPGAPICFSPVASFSSTHYFRPILSPINEEKSVGACWL